MTAVNVAPSAAAFPGVVDIHLPCRVCYHDLLNTPIQSACPGCGTPVESSLRRDLLRSCDPQWIDGLWKGIYAILIGAAVGILGMMAVIAHAVATRQKPDPSILTYILLASTLLHTFGWWFLTAPDPSGVGDAYYGISRKIIRFSLLLALAHQAFKVALIGTDATASTALNPDAMIVMGMAEFLIGIVATAGFFAMLRYLSKMALRIPDLKLADAATFLMWAIPGCIVLMLFMLIAAAAAGGASHDRASMGQALGILMFGALFVVAMLVLGIKFVLLLFRMAEALQREADWARQKSAAQPIAA